MARILVVDDDAAVRGIFVAFLERSGYQVTSAQNGQEGLAQIKAGKFDLVITDLEMPEMRGDEMLLKAGNFPPAIIASGRFGNLPTDADKVKEFPLLDSLIRRCAFIGKPFDLMKLWALVNELLAA